MVLTCHRIISELNSAKAAEITSDISGTATQIDRDILEKLEFGDGRARYEDAERDHHDHLIDVNSGEVIEFVDPEIEELQERIAARLGYRLIGHRLELLGVPVNKPQKP